MKKLKRHLPLLVIFFLLMSCQKKAAGPDHAALVIPDTITVLDYNVENMFDNVRNGSEYEEFIPGACNWTKEVQQAKVSNIAGVIAAAQPDIAVLEEVENRATVLQLQQELKKKGSALPYAAYGDRPNPTNTIPVVLSRFPILWSRGVGMPRESKYYTRNLLEAAVFLGPDTLIVFACHWPSKNNPESKRLSVALKIRERLMQLAPNAEYIVAGDFNSNYNECETMLFDKSNDTYGKSGLNHVLHTVSSAPGRMAAYVTKNDLVRNTAGDALYDPWLDIAQSLRMSSVFTHRRETPDHILLAPALFDSSGLSYVDNSFAPFTDNGRLLLNGEPYRWQYVYRGEQRIHRGQGFSDHLPLICKIRKGGFSMGSSDTTQATNHANIRPEDQKLADLDGWHPAMKNVLLRQQCSQTAPDSCSLRIEGVSGKSNGCVAFKAFKAIKTANDSACKITVRLRGEATLNFRARVAGGDWIYYNYPDFPPVRSGRYKPFSSATFKPVSFVLPAEYASKPILVELRVAKNSAVGLWIK